jgi:putative membrane protein insertion efficiency factor
MPADACPRLRLGVGQRAALFLLRSYQLLFSGLFTGSCRFTPSCSRYAAESIRRFGVIRGSYLGARRLMRCHPFGAYGFDPVPDVVPAEQRRETPVADSF